MMKLPIYLDYSATTPVDPRVAEKMIPYLCEHFGNPASRSHSLRLGGRSGGRGGARAGGRAGQCRPQGNRLDLRRHRVQQPRHQGRGHFYAGTKGKHIITVKTEHKAVLDTVRELERQGFEATYLDVRKTACSTSTPSRRRCARTPCGVGDVRQQRDRRHPADRRDRRNLPREGHHLPRRCGAGHRQGRDRPEQAEGRPDELLAHKTYGPKGIGALYVRRKPRVRLEAQMHGGGHERGLRSGTLATHQIVGMGEAFRLAARKWAPRTSASARCATAAQGLQDIEETFVNGDLEQRVPHNLNISFAYVEGESLIMAIKDLAVSSGSACTSASLEPSYVLRALGATTNWRTARSVSRIGRFTTEEEIDYAIKLLHEKDRQAARTVAAVGNVKEGIDLNTVQWAAHLRH
jgi:cysteine desulfurase